MVATPVIATPAVPAPSRRLGARGWFTCLAASFALLGQGERCRVDPRFYAPQATLAVCWEALRSNDAETLAECLDDPEEPLPYPGMLWFLPPTTRLSLHSIRIVPISEHRSLASYEVRFLAVGASQEGSFTSTSELVKVRGEWRLVQLPGEASTSRLEGVRRSVDI